MKSLEENSTFNTSQELMSGKTLLCGKNKNLKNIVCLFSTNELSIGSTNIILISFICSQLSVQLLQPTPGDVNDTSTHFFILIFDFSGFLEVQDENKRKQSAACFVSFLV